MIDWNHQLPQTEGDYLWLDLQGDTATIDSVVICSPTDSIYLQVTPVQAWQPGGCWHYKNDKGEPLVICFGAQVPDQRLDGSPYVIAWAPLNWPIPCRYVTKENKNKV